MKKVYFQPRMDGYNMPYDHPLFDEEVYIPPVPYLEFVKKEHEKHTYWKCPAWQQYHKNSYVFFTQLDIEVNYNKQTGVVTDSSYNFFTFDEAAGAREIHFNQPVEHQPPNPYHGIAVGQSNQHMIFWPEHKKNKNMWLEILPLPTTLSTHGAELIGGEYPFGRWFRPSLFAFRFHNEVTKWRRGDPLGIIKFKNTDNYSEDIKLERKEIPEEIAKRSHSHSFLKIFLPKKSWTLIKDDKPSKCPFWRFWK